MTTTDDINAILTAAGVPDTIERGGPGPDSGDSVEATTADRVRWLVADRDNAREDAQEYDDHFALCTATLEAAGIPKTYGIPGTATADDPTLTTRSDSVNAMIARLVAERDAARADLQAVRDALGNGANETAWPPGFTVARAVAHAVECRHRADETCALLYGDVDAQCRVIADACALLGVCEDSDEDWPKLPHYVAHLLAERDAARARLARVVPVIEALDAWIVFGAKPTTREAALWLRMVDALAASLGLSDDDDYDTVRAAIRALIADEVPRG